MAPVGNMQKRSKFVAYTLSNQNRKQSGSIFFPVCGVPVMMIRPGRAAILHSCVRRHLCISGIGGIFFARYGAGISSLKAAQRRRVVRIAYVLRLISGDAWVHVCRYNMSPERNISLSYGGYTDGNRSAVEFFAVF